MHQLNENANNRVASSDAFQIKCFIDELYVKSCFMHIIKLKANNSPDIQNYKCNLYLVIVDSKTIVSKSVKS